MLLKNNFTEDQILSVISSVWLTSVQENSSIPSVCLTNRSTYSLTWAVRTSLKKTPDLIIHTHTRARTQTHTHRELWGGKRGFSLTFTVNKQIWSRSCWIRAVFNEVFPSWQKSCRRSAESRSVVSGGWRKHTNHLTTHDSLLMKMWRPKIRVWH